MKNKILTIVFIFIILTVNVFSWNNENLKENFNCEGEQVSFTRLNIEITKIEDEEIKNNSSMFLEYIKNSWEDSSKELYINDFVNYIKGSDLEQSKKESMTKLLNEILDFDCSSNNTIKGLENFEKTKELIPISYEETDAKVLGVKILFWYVFGK